LPLVSDPGSLNDLTRFMGRTSFVFRYNVLRRCPRSATHNFPVSFSSWLLFCASTLPPPRSPHIFLMVPPSEGRVGLQSGSFLPRRAAFPKNCLFFSCPPVQTRSRTLLLSTSDPSFLPVSSPVATSYPLIATFAPARPQPSLPFFEPTGLLSAGWTCAWSIAVLRFAAQDSFPGFLSRVEVDVAGSSPPSGASGIRAAALRSDGPSSPFSSWTPF